MQRFPDHAFLQFSVSDHDKGMKTLLFSLPAFRPIRLLRANVHSAEEQANQKVHCRHRAADVPCAAASDRTKHKPTASAGKLFQFREVRIWVSLISGSR